MSGSRTDDYLGTIAKELRNTNEELRKLRLMLYSMYFDQKKEESDEDSVHRE